MVLCLGEPPRRFLLLLFFIFVLHFVFVLHSFLFFILLLLFFISFPGCFAMLPALHPGFSDPWRPPSALSFTLIILPYAPSPTFLTQSAFIKASLGAGSSSLKFAWLHTDPRNTDLTHLFVRFTVIHKRFIRVGSI